MSFRKIVQVAITSAEGTFYEDGETSPCVDTTVVALCDDGTVWLDHGYGWKRKDDIPQDDGKPKRKK